MAIMNPIRQTKKKNAWGILIFCTVSILSITNIFAIYASAFSKDTETRDSMSALPNNASVSKEYTEEQTSEPVYDLELDKEQTSEPVSDLEPNEVISFELPIQDSEAFITERQVPNYNGVQIFTENGTPVYASASGQVIKAVGDQYVGYGKYIIIDHGNGYQTLYAHNSEILVSVGDVIEQGDLISKSGRSGNATDYMLYYEIRYNGVPIKTKDMLQTQ